MEVMKPARGRRAERENGREGQTAQDDGGKAKDSGGAPNGHGQGGKQREDKKGEKKEKKQKMREMLHLCAPPARSPHHGRHEPYAQKKVSKKEQTEHVEARGHETSMCSVCYRTRSRTGTRGRADHRCQHPHGSRRVIACTLGVLSYAL